MGHTKGTAPRDPREGQSDLVCNPYMQHITGISGKVTDLGMTEIEFNNSVLWPELSSRWKSPCHNNNHDKRLDTWEQVAEAISQTFQISVCLT